MVNRSWNHNSGLWRFEELFVQQLKLASTPCTRPLMTCTQRLAPRLFMAFCSPIIWYPEIGSYSIHAQGNPPYNSYIKYVFHLSSQSRTTAGLYCTVHALHTFSMAIPWTLNPSFITCSYSGNRSLSNQWSNREGYHRCPCVELTSGDDFSLQGKPEQAANWLTIAPHK